MRNYRFTRRFEKSFSALPDDIAELFEKKLALFLDDMRHPSLRVKKVRGTSNPEIWEARLTMNYRFTFQIEEDGTVVFRNIGGHSILERNP